MDKQKLKVVIIGGVACGPKAAARIKLSSLMAAWYAGHTRK